ncbi:hypothetical protein AXF42_Ash019224 [Apostasia shenzhenica]|uniref:Uncharacterized protein n=1 Tax=Apostasia shenzhenica TaxID=1088818 RepID=A0A2I0A2Z5_9ASPA|nr:hypothetical protein AXF42_Ash019224 [Apostasia shenzhenica]
MHITQLFLHAFITLFALKVYMMKQLQTLNQQHPPAALKINSLCDNILYK